MNQQNAQINLEDKEALQSMDKVFRFMSIGYLVAWFVSLPFFRNYWDDASHGGFFDHIGVIAFVYAALSSVNVLSKHKDSVKLNVVTYALFGFFLAFPLGGVIGAVILSAVLGYLAYKRNWTTIFVTGSFVGYWIMQLVVSGFEYNPFLKTDEGIGAMIFEFLAALVNMADYNVHHMTLSWFLPVVLGLGYFFYRAYQAPTEVKETTKEKETMSTQVLRELAKREAQQTPSTPPSDTKKEAPKEMPKETPVMTIEKESTPSDSTSEDTQKRRYKQKEKPSKGFFNLPTPTSNIKWNNWWENLVRKISR